MSTYLADIRIILTPCILSIDLSICISSRTWNNIAEAYTYGVLPGMLVHGPSSRQGWQFAELWCQLRFCTVLLQSPLPCHPAHGMQTGSLDNPSPSVCCLLSDHHPGNWEIQSYCCKWRLPSQLSNLPDSSFVTTMCELSATFIHITTVIQIG